MDVWTEVITEDIAATHVGEVCVLVNIGDATEYDLRDVEDYLSRRRVREEYTGRMREMRDRMAKRQRARRRLERHGIGDAPL